MRVEIVVHRATGAAHALPLEGQLSIGRGPENDVVVPDIRVSWRHALIWLAEDDVVMVKDLGSRNGCVLEGQPITGPTAWPVGARLRIADIELSIANEATLDLPRQYRPLALEDVATKVRYPLRRPHVLIGDVPEADLRISCTEAGAPAVLMTHPDGEVWLGVETEERPLELGELFSVCGVELRVILADEDWSPTANDGDGAHPYLVEASFNPAPWARVEDLGSGLTHTVTAPNRVSLLFFAAEALQADRDLGVAMTDAGWRTNREVQVAVWGRTAQGKDARNLKALLHNVRHELKSAGLDPWCLEKRRGCLRLRVVQTSLVS